MIREFEDGACAFQYEEREGCAALLQWKGGGSAAWVPGSVAGLPIRVIERKAFLSNKRLAEIHLPQEVEEIGDWAFAYCSRLEAIWLPKRRIVLGKGILLQCERLEHIWLETKTEQNAQKTALGALEQSEAQQNASEAAQQACVSSLLAAAAHKMADPFLLDAWEAGSSEWLKRWDERLVQVLETPDREGYSQTLLCGEEDYGSKENNLDYFLSQKRKNKVRLCMLRLLHAAGLSAKLRGRLTDYLTAHTKGCPFEETWQVVKQEQGTRKEYYDLLLEIGALTEGNFDAVLCDMGPELAEMKAYLLKVKEERFGKGSFFDSLLL